MPDAITLHALIVSHQWTALVAVLLVLAVACWRKAQPIVWDKLPQWARYAIPTLVVGVSGAAESLQHGETWGVAVLTAIVSAWTTIGGVKTAGILAKAPPTVVTAILFVGFVGAAHACTAQQLQQVQDVKSQAKGLCEQRLIERLAPVLLTQEQANVALEAARYACAAAESECIDEAVQFRKEQLELRQAQPAREQPEQDAGAPEPQETAEPSEPSPVVQ
jgi:hypothetical protein